MTDRIPITAGEALAHKHGYDQVIIYARRVGTPGLEWVTTYGKTKEHCAAAARIGDALRGHVFEPLESANARAALAEMRFDELNRGFGEAAADVLLERRRQVEVEGWTAEHDDAHRNGEMAKAAACYAIAGGSDDFTRHGRNPKDPPNVKLLRQYEAYRFTLLRELWPWDWSWWKPRDRRRDLVRAAALIIAEIERLDRAAARKAGRS